MENKRIKLGNMSYADRKSYQYYKRALGDLTLYGPHYFKKMAEDRIKRIEDEYLKVEEAEE